jgi:hypothetical protein
MRTKDQILLEEAYQKILLNNVIKESETDKKESETDEEDMTSETETVSDGDDEDEDEEKKNYIKKIVKSENFVHGIQPIVEAKKKVNPWAIEKSMEKKTGKKFGKKHKEEIVKGIKKSAKKSGKKITSDKVKPKKK